MFAQLIFAYNRPYHTYKSLSSLSENKESIESDLIVFIGPYLPKFIKLIMLKKL